MPSAEKFLNPLLIIPFGAAKNFLADFSNQAWMITPERLNFRRRSNHLVQNLQLEYKHILYSVKPHWLLDTGSSLLDIGCWILAAGYCMLAV